MRTVQFHEVQSFSRNPVARWAGLGALIIMVVIAISTGAMAMEPLGLVILLAVGGLLTVLLVAGRMETDVTEDGVFVRVFPLTRRHHFPFDEIQTVEARTYRPIAEYGGWGIRYGFGGKAYNVHGNRGVQLTFTSGSKLLLGSQRAEELAETIRQGMA